ncbi:MAG: HAD hydrolase-like protein [Candidatus Hydrogenedentes bacterium]|nr:HAD hydrolase-like protein [Candidatus Hydrogenedentota bacterium]
MSRNYVPGTEIEIINEVERGRLRHALFDFDGTVSLMREGWQGIMAPVMIEMICGDTKPTQAIIDEVHHVIEETTGINTILQMERLVEMVRAHGLVPEDKILDAHAYKKVYNDRLMVPVNERIAKVESGALTVEQVTVRGSLKFLQMISARGLAMYLASGTDQDDVRNEARKVGAAQYFNGGMWGALRTYEESNKDKIIKEIIAKNDLHGSEVIVCGDGPVEIRNAKSSGCIALGVASNEKTGHGWDEEKRTRLIKAGADIMIADFGEAEKLIAYLFPN